MQGEVSKPNTLYKLRTLYKTISSEGIRTMYRGYTISLFSVPIFNTLYFPMYQLTKDTLRDSYGYKSNSNSLYALSAGIAGTICSVITNPLWLVRTRMQVEIFHNNCETHYKQRYSHGFFSVFKNVYLIAQ